MSKYRKTLYNIFDICGDPFHSKVDKIILKCTTLAQLNLCFYFWDIFHCINLLKDMFSFYKSYSLLVHL